MSVFTNPASRSAEQAAEYIAAVLALLGDRDPLDVLTSTPSELERAVRGLSDAQLIAPEAPGKWSIRHVLQHLADAELVSGYRLRMVLARDRPALTGYDQDEFAERLRYDDVAAERALEDFAVLRDANLRLLARVPAADLQREGVHAERGVESVAHMMRLYAGHDLVHLNQVERIRHAVTRPEPQP